MHIKITKGLDIPIVGKPTGQVHPVSANGHLVHSKFIGLDLTPFDEIKFKLLIEVGDLVKIGQPLLEDKSIPGRMFVSPAGGVIREIRRGFKRSLVAVVIEIRSPEEFHEHGALDVSRATRLQIVEKLQAGGLFAHIRKRPFNILANPTQTPRSIFVKAIESLPFAPSAELQIEGHEKEFQIGLTALSKLTDGAVNLVYRQGTPCRAFFNAENVVKHTAEGPHPIANHSLHIQLIDPIRTPDDIVWTVTAYDAVCIGHLLSTGRYFTNRIIAIGGPGIISERKGFFRGRMGYHTEDLIAGRIKKGELRLISGDVLTGHKVTANDFLGFYHHSFCVVPENTEREFLHFFRLGKDKYSATGAYLSGHLDNENREYYFTTSLHGERRAFVTSAPYEMVQPLRIPTMELVKSVMAEDYELAQALGILEVDSEDFALPTFIDPSKIEMVEIMKHGIKQYAKDIQ